MKTAKSPASITTVYWLVNLLLLFFVFGTIQFGIGTFKNIGVMVYFGEEMAVERVWQFSISTFLYLLKICLSIAPLIIFRRLIKNVRGGSTFSEINMQYLKKLAYILGALCLVQVIQYFIEIHWMGIHDDKMLYNIFSLHLFGWKLIVAVFTWSLAHIFSVGLSLQQEKDLTI